MTTLATSTAKPRMRRVRAAVLAALVALSAPLSGCLSSLLPSSEPLVVYRLTQPELGTQKDANALVVRVDNPSSTRTYNTRDILVLTAEGTISSAAGAAWADSIPQLVQDAALSEVGRSPRFISVIPVAGTRSDVRLHFDLREFAAVYDQGELSAPLARTHVYATLADASTRDFIGSFDALEETRAVDNRVSAIVAAQEQATRAAIRQVVAWMETLDIEPSIPAQGNPDALRPGQFLPTQRRAVPLRPTPPTP